MTDTFELRTMAHLLAQGRRIDAASRLLLGLCGAALVLLAVGSSWSLPWPAFVVLAVGFASGLVQVYYAVRVGFDAAVVASLAETPQPTDAPGAAAARLDASLAALGLQPRSGPARDWPARWRGMQALLRRQAACLLLQAAAFLLALASIPAR